MSEDTLSRRLTRLAMAVIFILMSLILLMGAFLFGREIGLKSASKSRAAEEEAAPVAAAVASARRDALGKVEQALARKRERDLDGALAALNEALEIDPDLPGARPEKAKILSAQRNMLEASRVLDEAISRRMDLSESYVLRGQWSIKQTTRSATRPDETPMEIAAALAPFEARPFYEWAELLRVMGRPREAVERLQQAERRADSVLERFMIRTKMALARVESADAEFLEQLPIELTNDAPPVRLLLAGAAHALLNDQTQQAAAHLERARERMPAELFAAVLEDPAFALFRYKPELQHFFAPPKAPAAPLETADQ